jgi:glutaminyl-peptide cyclotransferase
MAFSNPLRFSLSFLLLQILTLLLPSQVLCYSQISDDTLQRLPTPGNDFDIHNGALLSPILRTRVPGTPGSTAVLNHFTDFFKKSLPDWTIEYQNSTSTTPTSKGAEIPFVNFIAYRDPPWADQGDVGRLTLAAHYDSKLTPEGFIGATDSAAPCAMIMHAARSIDAALTKKWAAMAAEGAENEFEEQKGVQILFLDGEEAFLSWTDADSLYGARSLAEHMESNFHPALSTYKTHLNSISLFILLDLLGSKNPTVPSYFTTTHWAYQKIAELESRLRSLRVFKSSPNHQKRDSNAKEPVFLTEADKPPASFRGFYVQDDHVPFMARGVEVLHLIPSPFPAVWHDMSDDGEHLDIPTVEDWALLTTAFVVEWMELEGFFDAAPAPAASRERKRWRPEGKTEL